MEEIFPEEYANCLALLEKNPNACLTSDCAMHITKQLQETDAQCNTKEDIDTMRKHNTEVAEQPETPARQQHEIDRQTKLIETESKEEEMEENLEGEEDEGDNEENLEGEEDEG